MEDGWGGVIVGYGGVRGGYGGVVGGWGGVRGGWGEIRKILRSKGHFLNKIYTFSFFWPYTPKFNP